MKFLKFTALAFLLLPALCFCKESDVYIGVSSKYNPESLPKIGITNFFPKDEANAEERKAAIKLSAVMRSDLLRSRYFEVEDNLPKPNINDLGKTFAKYRAEGVNSYKRIQVQHITTFRAKHCPIYILSYLYNTLLIRFGQYP